MEKEILKYLEQGISIDGNPKDGYTVFTIKTPLPTEEQVLQTIFDCVFIRGIELEDYKRNFTNEQSGLYDALVKLFKGNDR